MLKKSIVAATGVLALTAALDASAYTYTDNPNGVLGLGTAGAGLQYNGVLNDLGAGQNFTLQGNAYEQQDAMDTFVDANGNTVGMPTWGVGQQSWCQTGQCTGVGTLTSKGWNHTSQHFLLHLTQSTDVTISLANAAADATKWGPNGGQQGILGNDLIPGFSLFSGTKLTGTNATNHTYGNGVNYSGTATQANTWPGLPVVGYAFNSTAPTWTEGTYTGNPGDLSVSKTFTLAAGDYTLFVGGTAKTLANADGSHGKNFALSIATAPVPVPAAVWLFGSALAGMGIIGRRKDKAAA